jgi:hypothetical protein
LDVLGFHQDPDQHFLLCLQESDEDIACRTEELTNLDSGCRSRFRRLKDKVVGLGLGNLYPDSLLSAAKWKKYWEIWGRWSGWRIRRLEDKVAGPGLGNVGSAERNEAAKWKKYWEIWAEPAESAEFGG